MSRSERDRPGWPSCPGWGSTRSPGASATSEEMRALMEDDPPGARGLATILAGAMGAHLRPQRWLARRRRAGRR